jgi:hypothetical protein
VQSLEAAHRGQLQKKETEGMGERMSSVPNEQTEEGCDMNKSYLREEDFDEETDMADSAYRRLVMRMIALAYVVVFVLMVVRCVR